jgi:ABC-2 type transport system permease protein
VSALGAAFTVGRVEVWRRIRDWSFPIQGIIGPVVIAVIVGLAFGGVGEAETVTIGIVDADGSAESRQLVDGLFEVAADQDGFTLERLDTREVAIASIEENGGAVIVVPAGFASNLRVEEPAPFEVLADPDDQVDRAVAESIAGDLATRFTISRSVVNGMFATGDVPLDLVTRAVGYGQVPTSLDSRPIDDWDPLTYFAPAMALMFLFFAIGGVARSLLSDERLGVLPRLLAAPVPSSSLLWGRAGASMLMVLIAMGSVLFVVGAIFRVDLGPLRWTLPVLLVAAATVAGLGTLIAGLSRTEAQADGWTSVAAFTLALAGGSFVAPGDAPDALQAVAVYTPNGRALLTHVDLVAGAAGRDEAIEAVVVLLAFTIVTGGIGMWLQRRTLVS